MWITNRNLFQQFYHALTQGLADEKVAFRIAEPVVPVAGVGGQFRGSCKVRGFDESRVVDPFGSVFLRFSEVMHIAAVHWSAIAQLSDHDGHVW